MVSAHSAVTGVSLKVNFDDILSALTIRQFGLVPGLASKLSSHWFPSPFFVTSKESLSERDLGGRMRQKTKTGTICHISVRAKSNPTN